MRFRCRQAWFGVDLVCWGRSICLPPQWSDHPEIATGNWYLLRIQPQQSADNALLPWASLATLWYEGGGRPMGIRAIQQEQGWHFIRTAQPHLSPVIIKQSPPPALCSIKLASHSLEDQNRIPPPPHIGSSGKYFLPTLHCLSED